MAKPRVVVRCYGLTSSVGLLSPLMTGLLVTLGVWRRPSADVLLRQAEVDAQKMAQQGYRAVSSEEREIPMFGVAYRRVTYELTIP